MFRNTQDAETMHDNLNNFKNICFFFLIVKRGRFDFSRYMVKYDKNSCQQAIEIY